MGLDNREYMDPGHSYRDGRGGGFNSSPTDRMVYILIGINVVVFLLQNMGAGKLTELLSLAPMDLQSFQIWRLLTYGFCHSTVSINHLLFNMIGLFFFGRLISQILGSREFLAFYLTGIVFSGLVQVAWQVSQGDFFQPSVGASGAISAIFLLTAVMFPRLKVLLFFIIPIEIRWIAWFMLAMSLFGLVGSATDNIAHAAHLGGCVFGIAYWYYKWNLTDFFEKFVSPGKFKQLTKRRPKLKIHNPGDQRSEKLDREVDEILAKISEQGEASLTDQERKTLAKASKKYRKDK